MLIWVCVFRWIKKERTMSALGVGHHHVIDANGNARTMASLCDHRRCIIGYLTVHKLWLFFFFLLFPSWNFLIPSFCFASFTSLSSPCPHTVINQITLLPTVSHLAIMIALCFLNFLLIIYRVILLVFAWLNMYVYTLPQLKFCTCFLPAAFNFDFKEQLIWHLFLLLFLFSRALFGFVFLCSFRSTFPVIFLQRIYRRSCQGAAESPWRCLHHCDWMCSAQVHFYFCIWNQLSIWNVLWLWSSCVFCFGSQSRPCLRHKQPTCPILCYWRSAQVNMARHEEYATAG